MAGKEVEITIKNGEIKANLISGFPPNAEADEVLKELKQFGVLTRKSHKPHSHGGVKVGTSVRA